jgi:hypothetical protein
MVMDLHELADLFADRSVRQSTRQVLKQFEHPRAQELRV